MKTENYGEMQKFAQLATSLWEPDGSFAMLHKMNRLRCQYIKDHSQGLEGKTVLDIGCGGGILSESLAALGAKVTAIDPCRENINIARSHSKFTEDRVCYKHITIEELTETEPELQFDIICLMEVVEHVDNLAFFIKKCVSMLKPAGKIFFSTINRTVSSYLLAIIAAEYVFRFVPKHTHSWDKFVRPAEVCNLLRANNIAINNLTGMKYNIFLDSWSLISKLAVNYIGCGSKY